MPDIAIDFESGLEKKFRQSLNDAGLVRNVDYVLQYPIKGSFILDFAFPRISLAVEVDGIHHQTPKGRKKDWFKTKKLTELGWDVLRFTGDQIDEDLPGCINQVLMKLRILKRRKV